MKQPQQQNDSSRLIGIFPTPLYIVKRGSNLGSTEEIEIEDIIKEGMRRNAGNSSSNNSDIFNGKLKKIKEFCEEHIKNYVKVIINPKEELDFYITQSWLNVTKPGEFHHNHSHSNSIISGVFYISTVEDDKIIFNAPNTRIKERIKFELKAFNAWNSYNWSFPSSNNELILFPSWLDHQVFPNEKSTTDRISISFNTFVRGNLGTRKGLNELILK
jgi:uncharacterized protein (TIGR02466 family)